MSDKIEDRMREKHDKKKKARKRSRGPYRKSMLAFERRKENE